MNVKTLDIYQRILSIIWQRLAPTFGQRTVAAIARNVVARNAGQYPVLQYLQVSEQGFQFEQLRTAFAARDQDDVSPAMDVLLDDFFDSLSELIGRLIVSRVMSEAKEEAEKGD